MNWNDLDMSLKAQWIKFFVDRNIVNLNDIRSLYNQFAEGGGIHIKPENRGKFTALNASHWNHAYGGPLPKPFSYSPIPTVRYAEGGLFSTDENQLILPTIFDWENSGIAEREKFLPGYSLDEVTIEAPAVLKELPESDLSENDYLNNQYKTDMLNEVKKLKGDLLKEVQRDLANKGYYDIDTSKMTVQQIKALLRRIGTEDDGIWGKKSIAKWRDYNVDGKYGKRTQEAFLSSKNTNGKWDRDVSTADTEWCALWVHKKAVDASGLDNLGVRGDAWRMPLNIVNKGGLEIFNIYKRKEFSKINGVQDLKYKTRKALLANPFDISLLKIGDVVGIYMPSSDMHKKALATGTTYNTHVGIVTGFNSEGKPIVEHNIHRSHRKDPADRLTGSKEGRAMIATVSRPNYSLGAPVLEIRNVDSKYKAEDDSPLFKQFADNIAGSKDVMRKIFPGADVDEIERISLAVQGRETGFMKNKKSDQTGYDKLKSDVADIYRDKILRKDKADISSNLSKLKFSSFSDYERKILGINTPEDLEDPNIAGKAVMYYMSKNWDYFKRMQEEYPLLGMTDDDVRYLTELSYNQGMSKLKNIGFKEGGIGAPEELEAIRKMADKDAKIRDITSTNYKHMGKVGEILYEINGRKGFTPYISSAEKYRQSLIDRLNKED